MDTLDLMVDGFYHHDRQLRIAGPSEPGRFIAGRVGDPVLWNAPNINTEAATERGAKVTAKPMMQFGRLKAHCIMDAREIDARSGVAG